MKRYVLKFISGPNKGKFVGDNPTLGKRVSVSKRNPRLWTSSSGATKYLSTIGVLYQKAKTASQLKVISLWLIEENQLPIKVDIWEHERGWGSQIDSTKRFPTVEEADAYVKGYNKTYNPPVDSLNDVPDWYMVAKRRSA